MRIGVVSDTHGYFDPGLHEALEGSELILHAGDVGSESVLDALTGIAPVMAVRGNVDSILLNLPPLRRLTLEGVQIEMLHILSAPPSVLARWTGAKKMEKRDRVIIKAFEASFDDLTRVVIFGHSHEPFLAALDGRIFFNPGSAGKQRFSLPRCCGILEISDREVGATVVSLGRYNGELPAKIRLSVGGAMGG